MLVNVHDCHWLVLVAWVWSTLLYHVVARPQIAAGAATALLKPTYTNSSISSLSPLTTSGSCWKCGIEAPGGIRLVYWEPDSATVEGSNVTLAPNDAQVYTQVDNGFTYTSPSVYVIYSSLRGTAACSTESGLYAVGPSFAEKTIAYSSRFLAYGTLSIADASCSEFVVVDGFHTIDFSSLYYSPITTTTTYKAGCAPFVNPRLSLPHELTNVDPRWGNCEPLFYGAFDPPSILTKASGGLVPSPVGAGQVTQPAMAQPMSELAPAAPAVTIAPPIAKPTNEAESNHAGPQGDGKPDPAKVPTPIANNGPISIANEIPTPQLDNGESSSIQVPQQQVERPSYNGQGGPAPAVPGNTPKATTQALPPPQNALPIQSSGSLGEIINGPFIPEQNGVGPAAKPLPVSLNSNDPAIAPSHIAVPIEMENGKPAYAIVEAHPAASGASTAQIAVLPPADSSSGQQSAPNGQKQSAIAEPQPSSNPGGTTKVILNDGSTADIPTADIIQPLQQEAHQGNAKPGQSELQSVQLKPGAFVSVPGTDGHPSSVAVQGGDYLLPKPTKDTPQQTLKLFNGQTTAVPIATASRSITLQGGRVTKIPVNAPSRVLTLDGGKISTFSPIPDKTFTLADGHVTVVPGVNAVAGTNVDSTYIPLQILTLANGQATTVPIQIPSRVFTLQDGSRTTLSADSPPKVLTLANGRVSTISSTPLTSVTLADGKVTSIPDVTTLIASDDNLVSNSLQTLTLKNGQVTTVPNAAPSPVFSLQGGKLTTLSADSAPETLTLANGKITTISSDPLTAVTLADGVVTSIPASYPTYLVSDNDFLTVPDATISGKVYYTRLPIVQLQNVGSIPSLTGNVAQNNSASPNSSALATAGFVGVSSVTIPPSIPTPSGAISNTVLSAIPSHETSTGNKVLLSCDRGTWFAIAAFMTGLQLVWEMVITG